MIERLQKIIAAIIAIFTTVFGCISGDRTYRNFSEDVSFSPLTAQEMTLTQAEKDACRRWFDENVRLAGTNGTAPAYNFSVDGATLRDTLSQWTFNVGEESAEGETRRGGKTTIIGLANETLGLEARVEATIYEENASCEWTVFLKNTAEENSGVITDFYAVNAWLPLGQSTVYCSKGSHNAAEDFTLLKAPLKSKTLTVYEDSGRSTGRFLPYFNAAGSDGGAVLGVGWTGNWMASLREKDGSVQARVKQRKLKAYLLPGEEIRSPLVSLSFYNGKNPVKGFNVFRNWILDCVYPENTQYVQTNMDILFVSNTRTAAEMLNDIDNVNPALLSKVANFWMDAGWYDGCEEDWGDGVGNWYTNPERFPDGVRAIADKGRSLGVGLLLWYEPERLTSRSHLYEVGMEHEHWLVDLAPRADFNTRVMWNLAEPEACAYLTDYIAASLKENGVAVYRQDFNYEPAVYWSRADRDYYGGRTGICENHYVTGLYTYLDGLFAAVPGLTMDNCASGGMRLDLEMTRRGVPMWRSDYNCDQQRSDLLEATQAHTYGLSCWLPVSGTWANFDSEYDVRSSIMPTLQTHMGADPAKIESIQSERELMTKQYFPLECGGVDTTKMTAMQFGDAASGSAFVYKHADVKETYYAVVFSGLEPDARYTVTNVDDPTAATTLTGAELMRGSYRLTLPEGRKAFILHYQKTEH